MSDKAITQAITSGSDQRKNVPVVTVDSFYRAHGEKLHLKLEGKRVGFHRKIREPTINRPGLALSGFYNYFAEKRVQVLGAAEQSYLKSLRPKTRIQRFRAPCARKKFRAWSLRAVPIWSRSCWRSRKRNKWPSFPTPMVTMRFINAATIAMEVDFSPSVTEFGGMVETSELAF